ncbi:GNAT family N-acetyltransferase [Butyricicoccus sp.]|uniref:GNAT family N-acetyltransferase n=1 Tax=Butyricicoccus sp. TaxID=2049021 RepID=UPI003D7DC9D5
MNYRMAAISDCEALTDLRMQMRKELDAGFDRELIYTETLDFFKRNLKSGAHIAFVCEHDGQLIATVGITLFEMMPTTKHPNGKVARLMNMYVEPFYRHKGIAKELLNCVMTYAKKHQIGKVMLNPSQMGKPLYVNYGFQLLLDEYVFYLD